MDELLKLKCQEEYLECLMRVLADKQEMDEAVLSRKSIKSSDSTLSANDDFDENGKYVQRGNVPTMDLGRFSQEAFRVHYGVAKEYSDRERLILESAMWSSSGRVLTGIGRILNLPLVDVITPEMEEMHAFKVNIHKICMADVLNKFDGETNLKSAGSFEVNKLFLRHLASHLTRIKARRFDIEQERSMMLQNQITMFSECLDRSWKRKFEKMFENPEQLPARSLVPGEKFRQFTGVDAREQKIRALHDIAVYFANASKSLAINQREFGEKLYMFQMACLESSRGKEKKSATVDKISAAFGDIIRILPPAEGMDRDKHV